MRQLVLAALILAAAALPASAASSATARSSAVIAVHSAPSDSSRTIARLQKNEVVRLRDCTFKSRWCYVLRDHGANGWVLGSYLVGSPAKLQVTPQPLFMHPIPFRHRPRH